MGERILTWAVIAVLLVFCRLALICLSRTRRALKEIANRLNALEAGEPSRAVGLLAPGSASELALVVDRVVPRIEARLEGLELDRRQLRIVLGGMIEGVLAIDNRRRLLFANESAYLLFGLDDSAVGRFLPELIRSPQVQQSVDEALASNDVYRGEVTMVARDGPRSVNRTLRIHGAPLPGDLPAGAVFVFHDVTELRRLETLRQDFVANVSHELKTPLASIKAYTETLLDWALDDEAVNEKFLHRIEEQADRLNQLIQDLLSLARLESGDGVFDHSPLELVPAVVDIVEAHRGRAESMGLEFQVDMSAVEPLTHVRADEEALRQILDNLVDNAIKYTSQGGWVRVSAETSPGQVCLHVGDSGIGIPRDDLPRIFERFYRVDKARSRELGGTGLGLSIVKHLAQSLGGHVHVVSRLGEGTRFTVQVPRAAGA